MALDVSITSPDGNTTYNIQCEVVEHTISRSPTAAALPGETGEGAGDPDVFYLDLGMQLEQITISGVLDNTNTPTKATLRTIASTWWRDSVEEDPPKYIKLTLPGSEAYYGGIKQASFRRGAEDTEYWRFSLVFIVESKV